MPFNGFQLLSRILTPAVFIAAASVSCRGGELARFTDRADELSRKVTLQVEQHIEEASDHIRRTTNYIIKAKGHSITLNVVDEVPNEATRKKLHEAPDKNAFTSNHAKTLFGPVVLAESAQQEGTRQSLDHLRSLAQLRDSLRPLPDSPQRKEQLARLRQDMAATVHMNQVTRTLADEAIAFKSQDWADPKELTRSISFLGNRMEAKNPISEGGGLRPSASAGGARSMDARRSGGTLADLEEAGLIDEGDLAAVRAPCWGLPMDCWTPQGARRIENPVPLGLNASLPGFNGPQSSIVVGKQVLMSGTTPDMVKDPKSGKALDTFLISRTSPDRQNPFVDYRRPATSDWVHPRFDKNHGFPMAGLHENGRAFVAFWAALAHHQGILSVVQYEDEGAPRVAIFDPSGIIIKLSHGEAIFGCLATEEQAEGRPAKVVWRPPSLDPIRNHEGFRFKEITRISLPSDQAGSPQAPLDGTKAVTTSAEWVIPRSLW